MANFQALRSLVHVHVFNRPETILFYNQHPKTSAHGRTKPIRYSDYQGRRCTFVSTMYQSRKKKYLKRFNHARMKGFVYFWIVFVFNMMDIARFCKAQGRQV